MKHSMTNEDGTFGITREEYLLFRAMYREVEINHFTWRQYKSPTGVRLPMYTEKSVDGLNAEEKFDVH